ncbi:bifunctional 4-hydroxy-2-oxoglutarate aldolase/2-dehydro-3-deoxy-phosphogluconate aldolase [Salimicrobium halophilum]|uniref:2-dehydro-3-deoxyphosphogluconate aldolase / (4S)-4-hydroxy-2-oxoglutarate aldolase n=1 Tax=Salimicrobium halophilum TaxID=86666 RepID=A0A1G8SA26_9BACI|nr:bifunctional 4-hydroxy-2-oxoglutarate aldolase/2-dehydro-3-deoxy-phosphogluconate aldolase [Salimicrobium halophilum]SDJ26068.1 2-dehydro-3-deoxyphosphogluconate aldolase / (4S)-4-hydroxy-2-oxoglutarate aldolase [Salimicrobium halophilum]
MSIQKVMEGKVVAVIRNSTADNIIPIIERLSEGGVNAVEITAETKGFTEILNKAVDYFEDSEVLIGAGTVNTVREAKEALEAGAAFIVSPALNEEVVKYVKGRDGLMIPGVLTPSEVMEAYHLGADMVKIFPASVMGPSYIKSIRIPLPDIPIMVTGGIHEGNMKEFFDAGAAVAGLGSELVDARNLTDEALGEISEKAGRMKALVQ